MICLLKRNIIFNVSLFHVNRDLHPGRDDDLTSSDFQSTAYQGHFQQRQIIQQQQPQQPTDVPGAHAQHAGQAPILQGGAGIVPQQLQPGATGGQGIILSHSDQKMNVTSEEVDTAFKAHVAQHIKATADEQLRRAEELHDQQMLEAASLLKLAQQRHAAISVQTGAESLRQPKEPFDMQDLRSVVLGIPDLGLNFDHLVSKPGGIGQLLRLLNGDDFARAVPTIENPNRNTGELGSSGSTVHSSMHSTTGSSLSLAGPTSSSKSLTSSQKDMYGVETGIHWPVGAVSEMDASK